MIPQAILLREAKRIALTLGATVRVAARTGEYVFEHPAVGRVRHNLRRKEASRALVGWLRRLEEKT